MYYFERYSLSKRMCFLQQKQPGESQHNTFNRFDTRQLPQKNYKCFTGFLPFFPLRLFDIFSSEALVYERGTTSFFFNFEMETRTSFTQPVFCFKIRTRLASEDLDLKIL